jgi:hypothetical protein
MSLRSTYIPRVPHCLSPRWNWDPPPPLPQASVLPSGAKGGRVHARLRESGGGVLFRTTDENAQYSVYSVGALFHGGGAELSSKVRFVCNGGTSSVKYS